MRFETQIIQNKRYKKFKWIRGILFIILIIVGTPAYYIGNSSSNRRQFSETLDDIPELKFYYYGLALLGIVYGIIHYLTWKTRAIGHLRILEESIEVQEGNELKKFDFSEFASLKLERGSTYHKGEQPLEKPYQGDNWIELSTTNGFQIKLEFALNSVDHNQEFEKIVNMLKLKLKSKFHFISI